MHYEVFQDVNNHWRWRLQAANNEIIATGEGYWSKADCLSAIQLVKGSTWAPIYEV